MRLIYIQYAFNNPLINNTMKLFITVFFFLPLFCSSQTTKDYNLAMQKFQTFYNAGQGDSINAMFGHSWDQANAKKTLWTNDEAAKALEELGTLESYKFIGIDELDPQKVYIFQTTFSKAGKKMTSCTLDKKLAFGTFRLVTIPDNITKQTSKQKKAS